jgi:hypothetical protein
MTKMVMQIATKKMEMKITDDGSYLRLPTDWILSTCLSIVR